ncbi:hypothetical protein BDW02DRAFT_225175 [Decorospora gaudefroyi]|uniref:Uncharacterized protein n=1 Tax=Decorospora gaudefroyi TaxID=184978 RepID=A0A6A5KMQ2_9PLEO|nr:hypothetical protein BDW02DRAFT_225175 [Decorospora gaudefroyi]
MRKMNKHPIAFMLYNCQTSGVRTCYLGFRDPAAATKKEVALQLSTTPPPHHSKPQTCTNFS